MTKPLRAPFVAVCVLFSLVGDSRSDAPAVPATMKAGELGRRVNPFLGTGGVSYLCGNVSPGATVPWGMVRLAPDTVSASGRRATNSSGYYYRDAKLLGFSHTRLSGTGAVDGGNFLVVPGDGVQPPEERRNGLSATLDHDRETAFPGYYAISLPDDGLLAELTATARVGVHRYTFAEGRKPRIQIRVTSALGGGRGKEGRVQILPKQREVEGAARTFGSFSGRYGGIKLYFVARFSRPFDNFGTLEGGAFKAGQEGATGDDLGVDLGFDNQDGTGGIELKVALSYVSIENARANLEAEAAQLTFDQVVDRAKSAWESKLGWIRVEGGTDEQQTIFATAVYRSLIMPTAFNDVNGEYLGFDGKVHRAEGFTYYTDMSLWDTFRTTHPLYTLIAPDAQRDMAVSLVEMSKQGGYLPRWPSGGGYTNSMFGTPADMVIAETWLKGIRDFDVETAYQAMKRTALGPTPPGARFSGREGIAEYLKFHYCPAELMDEAVSKTLEYCYSDYCIARLAEGLGHADDAALFDEHARYCQNLWNPETQYFHPRNSDGTFVKEFRPLLLTYLDRGGRYTNDYVEGSALHWRWAVPYDAPALISLFKSREYFVEELETFFAKSVPKVGQNPNAYYWQGNQPDLFAAYLFNAAGRPDLTQKWVRWILEKKHGAGEDGLDGNDDGGTLSAWYVWSSLGLYPVAGTDRYELAGPLWKRAEIKLGDRTLEIVAENSAPENVYVQRVLLNDAPLASTTLKHAEIAKGGVLRFEMGAEAAGRQR